MVVSVIDLLDFIQTFCQNTINKLEGVFKVDEKMKKVSQQDNIMQDIQNMIGNLLVNAVQKAHKEDVGEQFDAVGMNSLGSTDAANMGIDDIKNFVGVMQKFIDNINNTIVQLEGGSKDAVNTDDEFFDGYMNTADNILEIAAFSMKDKLTGLSNRNSFENRLVLEWNRAVRDKSSLSILVFGVEGYKDEHRDDVFKTVAKTLESSIKRSTDFIARWGDDEFAVLLPITEAAGAAIVSERIRTEIGSIDTSCMNQKDKKVSVYIGLNVQTPKQSDKPSDFIDKVLSELAEAKKA